MQDKYKQCSICGEVKQANHLFFHKRKDSRDGLQYHCKACARVNGIKTKQCSKCNKRKPLTSEYWHKDSTKDDGFHTQCRQCKNEYQAKLRQDTNNNHKKSEFLTRDVAIELGITDTAVRTIMQYAIPKDLKPEKRIIQHEKSGSKAYIYKNKHVDMIKQALEYKKSMTYKEVKGLMYNKYILKDKKHLDLEPEKIIVEKIVEPDITKMSFFEKVKLLFK